MPITVCPMVLCKNEEIWLGRVLSALVSVFPNVIVADTGSTDSTLDEIAKIPGVTLLSYKNLSPAEVGLARGNMQKVAKEKFGASHVFMVDADELYPKKYLRFIRDNPMPDGAMSGFTSGIECGELSNGECWLLGYADGNVVGLNRQAIFSVDAKWYGVYPFESPDTYVPGHPTNHYFLGPDLSYRFFHLRQMTRSRKDADVHMRVQKKYQFGLQDHPEIIPAKFWLPDESEYKDE